MLNIYSIFAIPLLWCSITLAEVMVHEKQAGVTHVLPFDFKDDQGRVAYLDDFFTPHVHLVQFVYFNCGSICSPFLNETLHSLRVLHPDFNLGKDFDLWTFSINPGESSSLASKKKVNYLRELSKHIQVKNPQSWHFMTGGASSIDSLTRRVGFHYEAIDSLDYNHKAVILVLDKDQNLVTYVHGPMLYPHELKRAILTAQGGFINSLHSSYLSYVYRLNEGGSHYQISIMRQILLACFLVGFLMIVSLALWGIKRYLFARRGR